MAWTNVGRICTSDDKGPMKPAGLGEMTELNSDMLQGLAELLQNETVANILHSIKLPLDDQSKIMLQPYDGKSCSEHSSTLINRPRFHGCRRSTAQRQFDIAWIHDDASVRAVSGCIPRAP
jgi:hypothetical protein